MRRILFCILFFTSIFSIAIDFSEVNTAYLYDLSAPVGINSRVITEGEQVAVFFEVASRSSSQIQIDFLLQDNYTDRKEVALVSFELDTLKFEGSTLSKLSFDPGNKEVLVIQIFDEKNYYYFPVKLKRGGLDFPAFYPTSQSGKPILKPYSNEKLIRIQSLDSTGDFFLYRYVEDFPPADPPMGVVQNINPSLQIDSLIIGSGSRYSLKDFHFYFVQNDTLSTSGFTLFAGPEYFPEYRRIPELIPTLTYFSKPSELNQLLTSSNSKKAFDNFWLSLFQTKASAKSAIRNYFSRVFDSNTLFTDYKQGWKTDRGLLYLIFGKPSEVYRGNFRETWIYDSDLKFEFRIISNLFAPDLYILMRDKKYQAEWFKRTKMIRGGK